MPLISASGLLLEPRSRASAAATAAAAGAVSGVEVPRASRVRRFSTTAPSATSAARSTAAAAVVFFHRDNSAAQAVAPIGDRDTDTAHAGAEAEQSRSTYDGSGVPGAAAGDAHIDSVARSLSAPPTSHPDAVHIELDVLRQI
jgi:hypothetical protein